MRSVNVRYFPAVDQLRAVAALLIVFYHGLHLFSYQMRFAQPFGMEHWLHSDNPLLAVLIEGHTAVALFMVLSGFILTFGSLDKPVEYWVFLRNRFLRTYPMFLLVIFLGIAALPDHFTFPAFLQTAFGFGDYAGALVLPPFSGVLWTLAVEWKFYVLFPFLLAMLRAEWLRYFIGIIVILLVLRALAVLSGGNARDLSYFNIIGRLDQFLIGMCAARVSSRWHPTRMQAGMTALVGLVLVVTALYLFHLAGAWPLVATWKIFWPTLEGAVWAIFIVGYVAWADVARSFLARALAGVGVISYSIYLLHFIVIYTIVQQNLLVVFTGRVVVDALLNVVLFALPVILALSALTYRYVELPFLRLRGNYHREQTMG